MHSLSCHPVVPFDLSLTAIVLIPLDRRLSLTLFMERCIFDELDK